MGKINLDSFEQIWCVDFEFVAKPGCICKPICVVAIEVRSGQQIQLWLADTDVPTEPPYRTDSKSLFVAYFASAEMGCHLALNWMRPKFILDLYAEFRCLTNELPNRGDSSLIGALLYFGLPAIASHEKEMYRRLIMRDQGWSQEEQQQILNYCRSDVESLVRLLNRMRQHLTPHALVRGWYTEAVAIMEHNGIPVDASTLSVLAQYWEEIKLELVHEVDRNGIFEGTAFSSKRFSGWLKQRDIRWPVTEQGRLRLDKDTFSDMAKVHPDIQIIKDLKSSLAKLKLTDITVGPDGRNRCLLAPFSSKTSRNQPSNSKFIFGASAWLRYLVKPTSGYALSYIDWAQQEFGIAATLSDDPNMISAYQSGDPYLGFAKLAKAVPPDATKLSHRKERELFKTTVLGTQYGMGAQSLAYRINGTVDKAKDLLAAHKAAFPKFWKWSEAAWNYCQLNGCIFTTLGWRLAVFGQECRTIQNFPMQANGAEMLRIAIMKAQSAGVRVCAPVHDAILIEAPVDMIDDAEAVTQRCMEEASEIILGGFKLKSEAKQIVYPNRLGDERGIKMWETICKYLRDKRGYYI